MGKDESLVADVTSLVPVGGPGVVVPLNITLVIDAGWGSKNVPPLGTCPWVAGTVSVMPGCPPAAGAAQTGAPSADDQEVGCSDNVLQWGSPGDWGGIAGHVCVVDSCPIVWLPLDQRSAETYESSYPCACIHTNTH
jgi:hypothetical protein